MGPPTLFDSPASPGVATVATHHRPTWGRGHSSGLCCPPRTLCAAGVSRRAWGASQGPEGYGSLGVGGACRPRRWCGGGGVQQGGLACSMSRLARLPVACGPPGHSCQGRPVVCGRWVRFKGLMVSGSVSVSVRACAPRAASARHVRWYPRSRVCGRRGPRPPGQGASPLLCPGVRAARGGGCAQALGVVACWGEHVAPLGRSPVPAPPRFPSSLPTRGPGHRVPGQRRGCRP